VTKLRAGRFGFRIPAGEEFLSSIKRPNRLRGPPSLILNWYWGSFTGVKLPRLKLITHLDLVSRLRMSGIIPLRLLYAFMTQTGDNFKTFIYIYICVCVCVYIYIYTHIHTYIYTHTHTHTNTHTHTHTHTHSQASLNEHKSS